MKVSIGPASIAGWLTAIGAEIGFVATAISGSEAQLHGPGKWMAIGGIAIAGLTNFGRQLQAIGGGSSPALPSDAEEAATSLPGLTPASAARPDGAV